MKSWPKKCLADRFDPKCGGRNTQFGPKTSVFFGDRRQFVVVVALVVVVVVVVAWLLFTDPD